MTAETRIPHVLHHLWLGPDPVPEIFQHYIDSWRTHHPRWDLRLWTDDTLPPLSCDAELADVKGFKTRYDTVRLEILRQFGGVIVDLDVEAIRPLDPLLEGVTAFAGWIKGGHVGNQVLGAVPRHPFFERAIERLRATLGTADSAASAAGKVFLKQLLHDHPGGVTVFPPETFYFEPSFEPARRPGDFPGVYAVHHELTSYAVVPAAGTLDAAIQAVVDAADTLAKIVGAGETATPDAATGPAKAQGRLRKAVERLRRAAAKHERGHAAQIRQLEAKQEQAAARLRAARQAGGVGEPSAHRDDRLTRT